MQLLELASIDHLNEVTAANAQVLLIISRNNCPGCDALKRTLDGNAQLQEALSGTVVAMAKLEDIPSLPQTFGVRQAPSMILFREDDEVARLSGFMAPQPLLKAVQEQFAPQAHAA